MSANKIAETSASTGTGNITLAGAWSVPSSFITGNRTFDSFYGLNHYFPYMIQDQSGNWEKGIGYLSGSTTLVRQTVTDNSAGTTALIDFPAGEKLVMVHTDAGSDWQLNKAEAGYISSAHQFGASGGTNALSTNRLFIQPFLVKRPMSISGMSAEVTTAVADTQVRAALYSVAVFSLGDCLMKKSTGDAVFDTSTTGFKDASLNAKVGAGFYAAVFASTGAPTLRLNTSSFMDVGAYSTLITSPHGVFRRDLTGAGDSLPASISGAIAGHLSGGTFRVCVRGGLL